MACGVRRGCSGGIGGGGVNKVACVRMKGGGTVTSARDEKAITKQQILGLEWLVCDTTHARAHKGSHAPRGGVGDGCGGGSVEGVVTGVEVAVAVTGTTGCATYCVFTQKPASLRASTGVGGGSNGSGSNRGDLYMHEGRWGQRRRQLKIRKQKEPIMQRSWHAPRGGVEAIVAAMGLGRRGRCRGGSDEGWWHRRRDMTCGFKMKEREKKKKKMAPGRMTARGWLACTCDAYEGDCNTRVDSATWTETATSSGHLTGLTCHSPVCMQTHCRRLVALVVRPCHLDMAVIRTLTPPRRRCFDTAATPTSTQQLSGRHDAAVSSQPLPPPRPPRHRYHHLNCHDAGANSAPLPPPRCPTQHAAAARPHRNTMPSPPVTASTVPPPTSATGACHPRTPFPIGRTAPCAGRGMMPPFPWCAAPYASTGHPDPTSMARNGATPTWPHRQCHLGTNPIATPPTTHARTAALWRLLYYTINSYM
ncbi:hypothetical protein EDB89DRAFT_1912654 [Lactarius sanguifluus]|nr:hypothetical protein EDB89DRAFT_1912654 [Lactarius sanguifluus]